MTTAPGYYARPRPEMVPFVPRTARRILDVGCGQGVFAGRLRETSGAQVWGIELDPLAAAMAAERLDRVITGDALTAAAELPDGHFDCAVMNDLLEHLVHPETLLARLRPKLAPGGCVVASIPNVRHFSNLWNLVVRGEWHYTDEGVLDRTHLRFFTRRSLPALFAAGGYRLVTVQGITPTRSWKFRACNLAALGRLDDARWLQFACVAVPDGLPDEESA
jgi:2-polyprenyl-3-methyl-5-hydroxy-6-metoxy-1,4-benzoquinol methylase